MEHEQTTTRPDDQGVTQPLAPSPFVRWRKAIAASAVGLGVGALLVTGALAAPPATPSTGSGTPTTQGPSRGANGTPATGQSGGVQMPGRGGAEWRGGPMQGEMGGGKVTAVSGSTITVQRGGPNANGAISTVTVSGDTTYLVGSAGKLSLGALSDVKVGSTIRAEGAADSGGNVTALLVSIMAPLADGQVTAVSGNTITIQGRGPMGQGATQTVTVGSGTQYVTGDPASNTASSLGAVTVGTRIHAEGTLNSDGSFSATLVRVEQARTAPSSAPSSGTPTAGGKGLPGHLGRPDFQGGPGRMGWGPKGDGTVTAISGSTITVQHGGPNASGATSTVTVTSSTVYLIGDGDQVKKGSLSDVQAGMRLHIEGNADSGGTITALVVRAEMAPSTTR